MSPLGIIGRVVVTAAVSLQALMICGMPVPSGTSAQGHRIAQVFSLIVLVGAGLSWL